MRAWFTLLFALALVGCDASEAHESPVAPAQVITGNGMVRGSVKFTGTPPVMQALSNEPCHDEAEPIAEESTIVNANGTLRNVFVYLEGAPATGDGATREPALLDQVDCRYVPHVIGVQVGQSLRVRSSDPTLHNVHALSRLNRPFNLSMTTAGEEKTVTFARHEFVPLKCDVHPWMLAYVGVFEHPWFVVTDDAGAFEIRRVPAGSYKLVTWHERYGRLEQPVEVADEQVVDVNFEYKAP